MDGTEQQYSTIWGKLTSDVFTSLVCISIMCLRHDTVSYGEVSEGESQLYLSSRHVWRIALLSDRSHYLSAESLSATRRNDVTVTNISYTVDQSAVCSQYLVIIICVMTLYLTYKPGLRPHPPPPPNHINFNLQGN